MTKKNWFFTILALLFGGMVISPGPGGAALRGQLGRATGNLWARIEDVIRDLGGFVNGPVRRKVRSFLERLRWIGRAIVLWPIVMIVTAMLPPHWAQNIVPVVALAPLICLGWLYAVTWPLEAILLAVAAATQKAMNQTKINAAVDELKSAVNELVKTLRILIGIELLLGLYLSIVPIAHDRWLLGMLLLALAATACFAGISRKVVWVGVLIVAGITLVFFLGGRDKAHSKAETAKEKVVDVFTRKKKDNQPPPIAAINYQRRIFPLPIASEELEFQDVEDTQSRTMQPGYFYGSYVVPDNWDHYEVTFGQEEGDWASIWCTDTGGGQGRINPSRIYHYPEDFSSEEFSGCHAFRLQGRGPFFITRKSTR